MRYYKYIPYCLVILFTLYSCKSEKKGSPSSKDKNPKTEIKTTGKEKNYSVYYELNLPFEILVNDLVVEKNMDTGMDGPDQLNQFILENGEQKIKIKAFHPFAERGGMFKPEDIALINEKLRIYLKDEHANEGKLQLIKVLKFPIIEDEVPFIEGEWSFDAEVPFNLEGWKNSKNLSAYGDDELEKMVISKFKELRKLLNTGNALDFMKELEFRNTEFYNANYFSTPQISDYEASLLATFAKLEGLMLPIENYKMRILGGGKVVSLERIGKYKGQSVLIAEDNKTNMLYTNYTMLYLPFGKNTLEIVRINPMITSLE